MASLPAPSRLDNHLIHTPNNIVGIMEDLVLNRLGLQEIYDDDGSTYFELSHVKLVFFQTYFNRHERIGDRGSWIQSNLLWPNREAVVGDWHRHCIIGSKTIRCYRIVSMRSWKSMFATMSRHCLKSPRHWHTNGAGHCRILATVSVH